MTRCNASVQLEECTVAKHEVAGFGRAHGQAHGFRVAQFADHQHVRILAQTVQQRLLEAGGVAPHFPLADEGAIGPEIKFDRTLDGHDVPGVGEIDRLNQRRPAWLFFRYRSRR